jgi:hypothetical protein
MQRICEAWWDIGRGEEEVTWVDVCAFLLAPSLQSTSHSCSTLFIMSGFCYSRKESLRVAQLFASSFKSPQLSAYRNASSGQPLNRILISVCIFTLGPPIRMATLIGSPINFSIKSSNDLILGTKRAGMFFSSWKWLYCDIMLDTSSWLSVLSPIEKQLR